MKYPQIDTKLIATSDCKMKDGSGNALIVGKDYSVVHHSINTEEIAVESELFPRHFFSINPEKSHYWGNYFDLK